MKKGQLVEVVDSQGSALKRRVVWETQLLVFVCTDEEFKNAVKQRREPLVAGWPKDTVRRAA